jgi:hypothetical protein
MTGRRPRPGASARLPPSLAREIAQWLVAVPQGVAGTDSGTVTEAAARDAAITAVGMRNASPGCGQPGASKSRAELRAAVARERWRAAEARIAWVTGGVTNVH